MLEYVRVNKEILPIATRDLTVLQMCTNSYCDVKKPSTLLTVNDSSSVLSACTLINTGRSKFNYCVAVVGETNGVLNDVITLHDITLINLFNTGIPL